MTKDAFKDMAFKEKNFQRSLSWRKEFCFLEGYSNPFYPLLSKKKEGKNKNKKRREREREIIFLRWGLGKIPFQLAINFTGEWGSARYSHQSTGITSNDQNKFIAATTYGTYYCLWKNKNVEKIPFQWGENKYGIVCQKHLKIRFYYSSQVDVHTWYSANMSIIC